MRNNVCFAVAGQSPPCLGKAVLEQTEEPALVAAYRGGAFMLIFVGSTVMEDALLTQLICHPRQRAKANDELV
jgi:hypothetical protein